LYINDLFYKLTGRALIYIDDTTLFACHLDPAIARDIVKQLFEMASEWFACNKLAINEDKTQDILFSLSKKVEKGAPVKLLGITLDCELGWSDHIDVLCSKLSRVLYLLRKLRNDMSKDFVKMAYNA